MCINGLLLLVIFVLVIVVAVMYKMNQKPVIVEVTTASCESFTQPAVEVNGAVLFATYNVDEDDYRFVERWSKDVPFYVVNNGEVNEWARKVKALPNVSFMERDNNGLDIGAWKAGMHKWDRELKKRDVIAFINCSIVCAFDLKQLMVNALQYDVYGLTAYTKKPVGTMIQTPCMFVNKRMYNSDFFKEHWDGLKDEDCSYMYAVFNHEYGFSRKLRDKGFKVGAYDIINGNSMYKEGKKDAMYKREYIKKKKAFIRGKRENPHEILNKNIESNRANGYYVSFN